MTLCFQRTARLATLLSAISLCAQAQQPVSAQEKVEHREQSRDVELMVGIGTAMVTIPTTIALGAWLGTLSNNLVFASVPALGVAGLIPPIAVALSAWLVGPLRGERGGNLWLAVAATTAVHVGVMVAAALLGLNAHEPIRVALFTAADSVLLPTVAIGALQVSADPSQQSAVPATPARGAYSARILSLSF